MFFAFHFHVLFYFVLFVNPDQFGATSDSNDTWSFCIFNIAHYQISDTSAWFCWFQLRLLAGTFSEFKFGENQKQNYYTHARQVRRVWLNSVYSHLMSLASLVLFWRFLQVWRVWWVWRFWQVWQVWWVVYLENYVIEWVDSFFEENKAWWFWCICSWGVLRACQDRDEVGLLLTSYLIQDNILVLNTNLTTSFGGIIFQQIIYHDLKVDKWNKYKTNKNFV